MPFSSRTNYYSLNDMLRRAKLDLERGGLSTLEPFSPSVDVEGMMSDDEYTSADRKLNVIPYFFFSCTLRSYMQTTGFLSCSKLRPRSPQRK